MMTKELEEQVRTEARSLKDTQDKFLQTYRRLCAQHGGSEWQTEEIETVFHHVRREVVPVMEQSGMDHRTVQALCSWAEKRLMSH
jgi:hypothetical protein